MTSATPAHAAGVEIGGFLQTERPRSVVLLRALPGLGDLLCAVPALRALRAALPDADITLFALPAARRVLMRTAGYVDELIDFPGWPGLAESPAADAARVLAAPPC